MFHKLTIIALVGLAAFVAANPPAKVVEIEKDAPDVKVNIDYDDRRIPAWNWGRRWAALPRLPIAPYGGYGGYGAPIALGGLGYGPAILDGGLPTAYGGY